MLNLEFVPVLADGITQPCGCLIASTNRSLPAAFGLDAPSGCCFLDNYSLVSRHRRTRHTQMSNLRRSVPAAAIDFAIDNQPAADAGADRDVEDRRQGFPGSE